MLQQQMDHKLEQMTRKLEEIDEQNQKLMKNNKALQQRNVETLTLQQDLQREKTALLGQVQQLRQSLEDAERKLQLQATSLRQSVHSPASADLPKGPGERLRSSAKKTLEQQPLSEEVTHVRSTPTAHRYRYRSPETSEERAAERVLPNAAAFERLRRQLAQLRRPESPPARAQTENPEELSERAECAAQVARKQSSPRESAATLHADCGTALREPGTDPASSVATPSDSEQAGDHCSSLVSYEARPEEAERVSQPPALSLSQHVELLAEALEDCAESVREAHASL